MQSRAAPYVMLFAAALIFGSTFSINKVAGEAGLPPLAYAFWQSLGAGLVLLGLGALRGALPGRSIVHLRAYVVIGALVFGLPVALLTYVSPHLPAGIMTLVLSLSPPITFLFGMAARIERFRWTAIAGIALGFAGVLILVGPGTALPDPGMVGWFLLALTVALMFAAANVLSVLLRPPAETSLAMATGVLLGAAALQLVICAATGQTYWFEDLPSQGDLAILLAVLVNAVFAVLFLEIIRLAGPVFFAQFNYLAVLAGIGWGWLVFSESLSALVWIAFALMAAGVILTSLKPGSKTAAAR